MSLLQEVTLDRLWARYMRRFGSPPPIRSANIDQTIEYLRNALKDGPPTGPRGGAPAMPLQHAA